MNPKYIFRKSDSERFTLQGDGFYTLDSNMMARAYRYGFDALNTDDFTWEGKSVGLTKQEKEIVEALADSWNKYLKLSQKHPMEHQEFGNAIHTCQYLIAKRVAARVDPEFWTQFK